MYSVCTLDEWNVCFFSLLDRHGNVAVSVAVFIKHYHLSNLYLFLHSVGYLTMSVNNFVEILFENMKSLYSSCCGVITVGKLTQKIFVNIDAMNNTWTVNL